MSAAALTARSSSSPLTTTATRALELGPCLTSVPAPVGGPSGQKRLQRMRLLSLVSRPVGQVRSQCPALVRTEQHPVLLAGPGPVTARSLGPAPARTARSSPPPRSSARSSPQYRSYSQAKSHWLRTRENREQRTNVINLPNIYLSKILYIHIHSHQIIKYNPLQLKFKLYSK